MTSMNSAIISSVTYVLASIFAVAGMGAAGVLIPNYVTLGMAFYPAILAGLLQNSFALSVATANNFRTHQINLRLGLLILVPAVIMVPLGRIRTYMCRSYLTSASLLPS